MSVVREQELVLLAEHLANSPITASDISEWTKNYHKFFSTYSKDGLAMGMHDWNRIHLDD